MSKSILLTGVAWLIALGIPAVATAQAGGATGGAAADRLSASNPSEAAATVEQVIVTARKQQEALIDVPVTVSALSAARLDAIGVVDFKGLSNYIPNIDINSTFSFNGRANELIIIRGMTPSIGANASVFLDGAPLTSGYYEGIDDVARVEVLKGPQTAYFGRSTFAGAINIITKAPSDDFRMRVDVTAGSDHLFDGRFTVEGPIVKDKLDVRVDFRDFSQNGTYKNRRRWNHPRRSIDVFRDGGDPLHAHGQTDDQRLCSPREG